MVASPRQATGRNPCNHDLLDWIRSHGKIVDPELWRNTARPESDESAVDTQPGSTWRSFLLSFELYDLSPQAGREKNSDEGMKGQS
jgi:hypothetical protein